jgi:hypothetical protein
LGNGVPTAQVSTIKQASGYIKIENHFSQMREPFYPYQETVGNNPLANPAAVAGKLYRD